SGQGPPRVPEDLELSVAAVPEVADLAAGQPRLRRVHPPFPSQLPPQRQPRHRALRSIHEPDAPEPQLPRELVPQPFAPVPDPQLVEVAPRELLEAQHPGASFVQVSAAVPHRVVAPATLEERRAPAHPQPPQGEPRRLRGPRGEHGLRWRWLRWSWRRWSWPRWRQRQLCCRRRWFCR